MISLQFSAQVEALRPDSCFQDWGLGKNGRLGRVKERKDRAKGREVSQVSRSLTGQGTLASCLCQEDSRDKRVPVAAAGSGPSPGKLVLEYPEWSGCQSQQRILPESLPVAGRGTPSRAPKWALV